MFSTVTGNSSLTTKAEFWKWYQSREIFEASGESMYIFVACCLQRKNKPHSITPALKKKKPTKTKTTKQKEAHRKDKTKGN